MRRAIELLAKVAHRISRLIAGSHFLCRLGGDEFAIIMPEYRDIADVMGLADAVITAVAGTIQLERGEADIGTSIGIALIPHDGASLIDLQRNADLALYRAKERGRGRFSFFEAGMSDFAQYKIALAQDLRRAIDNNSGLAVHYQPQVELATGRVTGFEALMRWTHPAFGNVPPSIRSIAESSQLICDLGLWIMRQAARQAKEWLDAGEPAREVAVNVSAAQISNNDLAGDVARVLQETGLPPHLLCLELTESLQADHGEARFRGVLLALKELGVTLALDDFGTDYSWLGYLTQLPFDILKIDRMFVDGITETARARKLLEGIIALGHGLGMTIVAEGAERPEEVEILKTFGCDLVQGYMFARPAEAKRSAGHRAVASRQGARPQRAAVRRHGGWTRRLLRGCLTVAAERCAANRGQRAANQSKSGACSRTRFMGGGQKNTRAGPRSNRGQARVSQISNERRYRDQASR